MLDCIGCCRVLLLLLVLCLPLALAANPGKGKAPDPPGKGKAPGKGAPTVHIIDGDLEVLGDGWFAGALTLYDPGTGTRLRVDPAEREILVDFAEGLESLWFEPGYVQLSGGLALGFTEEPWAGIIRWNGQDFEGFDGMAWVSLTGGAGDGGPPPPVAPPGPSITEEQAASWDLAYSWGDHRAEGYLSLESDPVFLSSPAAQLTHADLANLAAAFHWGDHAASGYLTAESDPVFAASPAGGITAEQVQRWESTFGWGDHRLAGYLSGESDPSVQASAVGAIPRWDGQALVDSSLREEEGMLEVHGNVRITGALETGGEVVIRRMPRQGDIFMGPFGRPEDAGPGQ